VQCFTNSWTLSPAKPIPIEELELSKESSTD
jgi:hypothetical protein